MLLSDVTKLAVAVADVDRFCWNLVTCLQFNDSVLAKNFVKIWRCLPELWQRIQCYSFSWTQSIHVRAISVLLFTDDVPSLTSTRCEQFVKISEVSTIFYHGKHSMEMVVGHADIFGISCDIYHLKFSQKFLLPICTKCPVFIIQMLCLHYSTFQIYLNINNK